MSHKIKISAIEANARFRPPGYFQDVLLNSHPIDSETVEISDEEFDRLKKKYRLTPNPAPTIPEMLSNFGRAVERWARDGFPIAAKSLFRRRLALCKACPFWDAKSRLGLGNCNKCGCTRLKHWMRTERCPLNKW